MYGSRLPPKNLRRGAGEVLLSICSLRMYTQLFSTASKGGGARSKQPAARVTANGHKQDLKTKGT